MSNCSVLEEEMNDVRKKLIERERENDFLRTEMQLNRKRGGTPFPRARYGVIGLEVVNSLYAVQ